MTALHLGAQWGGLLSREANAMAAAAVIATAWAAGIVALGRVLATERDAELAPVAAAGHGGSAHALCRCGSSRW